MSGSSLTPRRALDAVEGAMQANAGTHGERWRTRSVMHHLLKGVSHAARAGVRGDALDEDGLPHLVLAATRLVLAVEVLLDARVDE